MHFNPSARWRDYQLLPLKSEKSNRLVLLASGPSIEHNEGKPLTRSVKRTSELNMELHDRYAAYWYLAARICRLGKGTKFRSSMLNIDMNRDKHERSVFLQRRTASSCWNTSDRIARGLIKQRRQQYFDQKHFEIYFNSYCNEFQISLNFKLSSEVF
jgi:hypothetical protein